MSGVSAVETPDSGMIRTMPRPHCPLCGGGGTSLYSGLRDALFGAPGAWRFVRCERQRCGLLWLDPQPLEADIGRAYSSYYTHKMLPADSVSGVRRAYRAIKDAYLARRYGYATRAPRQIQSLVALGLRLFPDRRQFIEGEVMHLSALPNGRMLDVGCGNGRFMMLMREHGWAVSGVDSDPAAIDSARRAGLDAALGDLHSCRFESDGFDAIAMRHVIEHVYDPVGVLRECRRVLKPGGRLAITTPNASSWGHAIFGSVWRGLEPPRHIQIFTPTALADAAGQAGFLALTLWTSARSRGIMAAESLRIAAASAGGGRRPVSLWTAGLWFRFIGGARLVAHPLSGEEIMLIATK